MPQHPAQVRFHITGAVCKSRAARHHSVMRTMQALGVCWLLSTPAKAADDSLWLEALAANYIVMDLTRGDLDGDGIDETVMCYREDVGRSVQTAGVVVLQAKNGAFTPVFHVQFDATLCEQVRVSGGKLGVLLSDRQQLVLEPGKSLLLRHKRDGLYQSAAIVASSIADTGHSAERAFDGDLTTSWAEGTADAGIGQTLRIRFAKPTDVSVVGLLVGDATSARAFEDSNRVHDATLTVRDSTTATARDELSGDDTIRVTTENRRGVLYVPVHRRQVLELELNIGSVFRGEKRNETHISEVDVVVAWGAKETIDLAKRLPPPKAPAPPTPAEAVPLGKPVP